MIRVDFLYLPPEGGLVMYDENRAVRELPTPGSRLWRGAVPHLVVSVNEEADPPEVWLRVDADRARDVARRLPDGFELTTGRQDDGRWFAWLIHDGNPYRDPSWSMTDGDEAVEIALARVADLLPD